ncbi:hypothetical protein JAO29_19020 [Edaphobacter sp. HDX4]|uniref:hypothetical protein n=1 Tax=Edaphobacter sp. HDX4 TaxID=2794064 RepID=UPI002FE5BFCD
MFVLRTMLLAATACLLSGTSIAQSSEGAAMATDSHDKACIQLKDAKYLVIESHRDERSWNHNNPRFPSHKPE